MRLLFHTIALEPARWTPQRTSRPLTELLPHIAAADFRLLEIYEPHLTAAAVSAEIKDAFAATGLTPEILSSYLNLNRAVTSDAEVDAALEQIRARIDYYGFRKIRLFPGPNLKPSDTAGTEVFVERLRKVAGALPDTEILLETHDGSLADDPEVFVEMFRNLGLPRVGLLYQPTLFEPASAWRQFQLQQPFIRHLHLQNRHPDLSFAPMADGIVPWPRILAELNPDISGTLEFVPAGICSVGAFDLATTLRQARSEADYILSISPKPTG